MALSLSLLAGLLASLFGLQDAADDTTTLLEAARVRLEDLGDPGEDPERMAWREALNARIATLEERQAIRGLLGGLSAADELASQGRAAQTALDAERGVASAAPVVLIDPDELATYDAAFDTATGRRAELQGQLEDLKQRQADGETDRERLRERIPELEQAVSLEPGSSDLERFRQDTERHALTTAEERDAYLKQASTVWGLTRPVVQLELDLALVRYDLASEQLDQARTSAAALREAEADEASEAAEVALRAAETERDPLERFRQRILAETQALVAETAIVESLIDELASRLEDEIDATAVLAIEEQRVIDRMELRKAGRVDVVLRAFERARRSRELLAGRGLVGEIAGHDVRHAEVLDRLWDLSLPPDENPDLSGLREELGEGQGDVAEETFDGVVEGADGLLASLRRTRSVLERASQGYGELAAASLDRGAALDDLLFSLQARLFWRRSAPWLFGAELLSVGEESARLVEGLATPSTWKSMWAALSARFFEALATALLFVCALALHNPLRRFLARPVGRSLDEVRHLLLALAWVISLPVVFVLAARAADGSPEALLHGPAATLLWLHAAIILGQRVSDALLMPGGYALRGELVQPQVAEQLQGGVKLLARGAFWVWAPAMALRVEPLELIVLPRLLDVAWLLVVAVVVLRLLSWKGALVRQWSRSAPTLAALLRTLFPLSLLVQAGCIVLAVAGYEVASRTLGIQNLTSVGLLVGLSWMYVLSVRIAGRLARRVRRRVRVEEGEDAASDQSEAVVTAVAQVAGVVATVAAFAALQAATGTLGAVATFLAALNIGTTGEGVLLTAWDVVMAILWIGGGHLLASQASRLYEQVLIPLVGEGERGARFALLTLCRYGIVLVSWVVGLTTVGVSMESVGWMMTAISVGLGFGLQEIVANFVSGLILLFERPVRVGDVITVGQTGGTVDQIQIRATVVTNWERQTIIIPNKALITQNLTNWTRTDRVVRKTLDLRVAYGTDIEKVLRVAHEVLVQHPKVLEDPPPRVWFNGFGEYSLDFELWFFAQLEDGLTTRSALYESLYAALKREGIEIPLPRRDVRVSDPGAAAAGE